MEKSVCTIKELGSYVDLSVEEEKRLEEVVQRHPIRVTHYYMSLIDWDDPNDPIRKMAIPSLDEFSLEGSYDTSGEKDNTKLRGLQHKYEETALILATNRCATYCRHCFRKRLVGLPSEEIVERFEEAAKYVKQHQEINNVLISGGDPLVLSNEIIEKFLSILSDIPHIRFIRFGSRAPVTYPSRFEDEELLETLKKNSHNNRRLYVVTQFNHPREITKQSTRAISNLIRSGVLLNNQTVLLKGVNDCPETLAVLQNKLVSIGVSPYYVFQCRPVRRVKHHFQIPLVEGVQIVEEAKARCNGLSKRFKYIMSHKTGKIEILGIMDERIYFKYHQAKSRENLGKMFKLKVNQEAGWLDDLEQFSQSPGQDSCEYLHSEGIRQQHEQYDKNALLEEDPNQNITFSQ
jgi:lysine 2,3-aminomutase